MTNKMDEDAELFLDAVTDVKRLKGGSDIRPQTNVNRSMGIRKNRRIQESKESETPEPNSFLKPGVQRIVLRRLRRGDIPIEDELDLHGYTAAEAERELTGFLMRARVANRQRGVRVIHGRGLGSPDNKGILKEKTLERLTRSDAVLAFCMAAPAHGGAGAVHVLLKKR
jgi:DNA-nicking Smr family endonuclease